MIRLFILVLYAWACQNLEAQPLEVQINQIKDGSGVLMVALYQTENTFTHHPWKGQVQPAGKGTVKVAFQDIPPGEYAISVIHDANKNGKLDTNFLGIPKEGFGFSNDAMGKFGPPSFEKVRIKWSGQGTVTINLRYLH